MAPATPLSPLFYARIQVLLRPFASDQPDGTLTWPNVASLLHNVTPIPQKGPQCGLVALAMAGELIGVPWTVEKIFEKAKAAGLTNHGEIFSSAWMEKLAATLLPEKQIRLLDFPSPAELLQLLSSSPVSSILVPYDSDRDHGPCLRRGHSAHWAIIVGFVVVVRQPPEGSTKDVTFPCQHWLECSSPDLPKMGDILQESLLLLAYHGKSRHLGLWRYEDLRNSCGNLAEVGPKRASDGLSYQIPSEPLSSCLANQVIFISESVA